MKVKFVLNLFVTAFVSIVLVGCSGKTITTKNAEFGANEDPVCELVEDLCDDFDLEEGDLFDNYFNDCNVTVSLEKERYMPTNVKAINNSTKSILYERSLSKIDEETYEATFKYYNSSDKFIIAEFSGILSTDVFEDFNEEEFAEHIADIDWKEIEYDDILDEYYFDEISTGEIKFHSKDSESGKPYNHRSVRISDYQIIVTDFWPNGQPKIVKEYDREDEEITSAYNYNEDGSNGNPVELASLINDRWVGFTSNLHNTRSHANLFLILRTDEDDWHFGKVMICYSDSGCQSDYTYYQQGEYEIDDHGRIRLYNMKNSRGGYANECRLSIDGESMTDITITGSYDNCSARFVSDLNMKNKSWFKNSLSSKYRMN